MGVELPSGYGCSDECGCEHCLRLSEALAVAIQRGDRWKNDYWDIYERWSALFGKYAKTMATLKGGGLVDLPRDQEHDEHDDHE